MTSKLDATILTERMSLRPLRHSDAGPMTLYASDRRVAEMLENVPHPYPPGAAEAFIKRVLAQATAEQVWALDATRSGRSEFIGVISLRDTREGVLQLGYWIGPPFWRVRYATEAVGAIVEALRAEGPRRVEAQVVAHNEASARVLRNTGFSEIGSIELYSTVAGGMAPHRHFALETDPQVAGAPLKA